MKALQLINFGTFEIKYGYKGRKKSYGAVFTCLTTRAVHVELVSDMSSDMFLLTFRRFISLYGTPKRIHSDNGSNFVGAAKELRMMIKTWRELRTVVEDNIIEWTFSTPLASHHNGVVECMVKSVKNTLNKIVKGRILTEEEYRTVFAEVTKCVN